VIRWRRCERCFDRFAERRCGAADKLAQRVGVIVQHAILGQGLAVRKGSGELGGQKPCEDLRVFPFRQIVIRDRLAGLLAYLCGKFRAAVRRVTSQFLDLVFVTATGQHFGRCCGVVCARCGSHTALTAGSNKRSVLQSRRQGCGLILEVPAIA
jgi:hypothetical protein